MSTLQLSCPECDALLNVSNDVEEGEIFTCSDCAEELEVRAHSPKGASPPKTSPSDLSRAFSPFRLERAPQEEEDWGE